MSTPQEREIAVLQARIKHLETLVYIPGLFQCPKCQLVLSTASFSAAVGYIPQTGKTSADCLQCHTPMWPVTWQSVVDVSQPLSVKNRYGNVTTTVK